MRFFSFFFFKSGVYFTHKGPTIFQVLNSHMRLVAIILDSVGSGYSQVGLQCTVGFSRLLDPILWSHRTMLFH